MYARNSASPRPITVGQIILIADGTVQTTGVSAKIRKDGGTWTAASGSTSVEEGVWSYTPTQGETDCEALEVLVYKASCYQAWQEVITTAVATFGKVQAAGLDANTVTASALATDAVTEIQSGLSTFDANSDTVTVGTNNDKTGYSLTAGTGLGNQTANITGNLSGSVGSVTAGVTVTTNNDKTGYSLATAPPTAAAIADAVWDEATAGHTTADTYGGRIVRSINSNVGVQITGSSHIAADVHEIQNNVLTSDATAASFVTEIQAGLATSAALAVVDGIVDQLKSRTGYTMSILAGAIANAQNAAEAYTITLDGTAYSVTYSGLDSSGNRTGATLTET